MATLMEMINQGIGGLNTPLGMLGTQLLANSGFDPNATGASRLGNAFAGVGQQQAQMQQMQMQGQLRQQQMQELALRQRAAQQQEAQRTSIGEMLKNNPGMMKNSPMAAAILAAGGDPADAAALGKLEGAGGPQMAKMPWTMEQPNPDGTRTFMKYNLETGGYEPVSTYKAPNMMNAEANVAQTQQNMQYKPIEVANSTARAEATGANAEVAQSRLALEQQKAAKEMEASAFKKRFDRLEFKTQYQGATKQFDEVANLADEVANSPALKSLYGPNGYIPPVAGSDAADLAAKIERLGTMAGFGELQRLKQNGVSLTPVSNVDLLNVQKSAMNASTLQSDKAAQAEFQRLAKVTRAAKEEASARFNEYDSLFSTPSAGTAEASGPAQISDDAGYNALPSGAMFIGPDGQTRRKP